MYKAAYYPHNIHFVMVSAQMGGDAQDRDRRRREARRRGAGRGGPGSSPIMQPVKASPYTTHAPVQRCRRRSWRCQAPPDDLVLVTDDVPLRARGRLRAQAATPSAAQVEIDALAAHRARTPTSSRSTPGACRRRRSCRPRAWSRPAASPTPHGDLDGAAKAYEEAIAIEDGLATPSRRTGTTRCASRSASVRLRQGRLDDAEKAFRESLARVRNNGWALAGLVEVDKRQGDAKAEQTARASFERAWFGAKEGPDLARL